MKTLTVDYTPATRRVSITVPDDTDATAIDPYDWYEEIMDAVEHCDVYECLDACDDDHLTVVSLTSAETDREK